MVRIITVDLSRRRWSPAKFGPPGPSVAAVFGPPLPCTVPPSSTPLNILCVYYFGASGRLTTARWLTNTYLRQRPGVGWVKSRGSRVAACALRSAHNAQCRSTHYHVPRIAAVPVPRIASCTAKGHLSGIKRAKEAHFRISRSFCERKKSLS